MAHIKSRKYPVSRRLNRSAAVALAAIALPGAVYAQSSADTAAQSAETLPEITVQGVTDTYKADAVSSPKFTQPLLNTPQTITVIKKELVQQQGGTTLTEALRNTPGVSTFSLGENGNTNTGDAIYMRGFDTSGSIFVDGIRDLGSVSRDVFNIEQIEVIKGPAGTDNGRSAPSGSINLVTKQPTLKESYSGSAGIGSDDYRRVTADLNKPFNTENGTALRVNLLKEDSGVAGRDVVENDRQGVAAALAFGLKTRTRTYLNYLHVDQDNIPDGGVPTIGLPGYNASSGTPAQNAILNSSRRVDPSNFYGTKADFDDVKADMFTVRVEHDFSPDLRLQNTTRYGKLSQHYLLTGFMRITPEDLTLARTSQMKNQDNEIITNQTNLTMSFDTGSIKHSLVTGLEFTREKQLTTGYDPDSLGTLSPADLYNPDPNVLRSGYNPTRNGVFGKGEIDTISAYVFDTLELSPKWQLNGGVRFDRYDLDYTSAVLATTRNGYAPGVPEGTLVEEVPRNASDTLVTWKLGALYKPTENSSLYAFYSTSKQPPGGANITLLTSASNSANANYDPQVARTAELGGKWDLLDNRLGLTAALYRTDISNEVVGNATDGYSQIGEKRVEGIELGLVGEITPVWSAVVGYTTMDTKVVKGTSVTADGSDALSYAPEQAFTAWTTYKLPAGFTIGGGARFVDKLKKPSDGATDVPQYADSYWVYDAMATYTVNKNLDLQLNFYNLTNEKYVAAINKSGYRYTPGTERSVRLAANLRF